MNSLLLESSRLLTQSLNVNADSSSLQQRKCSSKHLCLQSKAAVLILLWTTVVGVMYYAVQGVAVFFIYSNTQSYDISISVYNPLPYAILAFVMIFYPLSGFIADVYCRRLKTVVISLCLLLSCAVLVCLVETALSTVKHSSYHNLSMVFHSQLRIAVFTLVLLSLALFIIGLAGYEANFIQLGLDQLFEAPSQYLGLFVHYATWTFHLQWICTGANSLLFILV